MFCPSCLSSLAFWVSPQIVKWFWEVMGSFEKEQLARVLQFVTGTSGVPSQGFSVLQVMVVAWKKGEWQLHLFHCT